MFREGISFLASLSTVGRASGKVHTVVVRLVYHQGKFYASRRDICSDWCRNIIKNPSVTLLIEGKSFPALARVVADEELSRRISSLKYKGERAGIKRVVVEVIPAPSPSDV